MVTATGIARIALVAKGHFLSMASESVLRFGGWERSIKVLPINLAANGGVVGIITLKNRTVTPVAQLFIDCARGGKASGKAPMPAASGLSDGFRRILPVPARSGGGRLAERTPAVQPRRRERVKLPLTGHRVITLRRDSGLGAAYCRCSGLLRRAGDRSARAVLRRGLIIQAKNLISCAT